MAENKHSIPSGPETRLTLDAFVIDVDGQRLLFDYQKLIEVCSTLQIQTEQLSKAKKTERVFEALAPNIWGSQEI